MPSEPTTSARRPRRGPPSPTGLAPTAGFTTIELMVVMAILVLLAGIVVVGLRNVSGNSQKNQTKTIMERMRSATALVTANKAAGEKFFQSQIPYIYAEPLGFTPTPPVTPATVAAEWWEAVRADTESRREATPTARDESLFRTALVVKALLANPEAKAIFDELPTERRKLMHFNTTTGAIVPNAGAGVTSVTLPLDAWGNPLYFVFDNWQVSVGGGRSSVRTTTGGVETGGLTHLESASQKGYWQTPAAPPVTPALAYAPPSGWTKLGDAWRSPDRQPFWASAGPDGNFRTHDDNVYSFEN